MPLEIMEVIGCMVEVYTYTNTSLDAMLSAIERYLEIEGNHIYLGGQFHRIEELDKANPYLN